MTLNWIEIDAEAIRSNLRQFRHRLGESVGLGAVVKANAYGHGMLEVAELAVKRTSGGELSSLPGPACLGR